MTQLAEALISWHAEHGRHHLPWQQHKDPYKVWLSEIMLQQTQVDTVIPYYERFLQRFPNVQALAQADLDDVLALWSGLGYYARARNLHRAAQIIATEHNGIFPNTSEAIQSLPGIGRSTAAAIAAFCFGERAAILDGNVKRVFARYFGIKEFPGNKNVEQALWQIAEAELPANKIDVYTQALMDLGATLCKRSKPSCVACPVNDTCVALRDNLQHQLPVPRPQRAHPHKHSRALVLRSGSQILLEKRPPSGIWGGLYSLPEIPENMDVEQFMLTRFGIAANTKAEPLDVITHSFTHFKLHLSPLQVKLSAIPHHLQQVETEWVALDSKEIGVPSPIRKLLQKLATGNEKGNQIGFLFEETDD